MLTTLLAIFSNAAPVTNRTDQYVISNLVIKAYSAGIARGYNRGISCKSFYPTAIAEVL